MKYIQEFKSILLKILIVTQMLSKAISVLLNKEKKNP